MKQRIGLEYILFLLELKYLYAEGLELLIFILFYYSSMVVSKYCRIGNLSEWFILPNFSEWGQFGIMKVGNVLQYIYSIIHVLRILTFNICFSLKKSRNNPK